MAETPKCKSWLGHKFEGRFSTEPPPIDSVNEFDGTNRWMYILFDALTKRTYECDICVRCGHKVMK